MLNKIKFAICFCVFFVFDEVSASNFSTQKRVKFGECDNQSEFVCVNVCCPHEDMLDVRMQMAKCVPTLWPSWGLANMTEGPVSLLRAHYGTKPSCPEDHRLRKPKKNKKHVFSILPNGSLLITHPKYTLLHPPDQFCVGVSHGGAPKALVCRPVYIEYNSGFSVLLLVGAAFLLATLLVHAGFPELRRTVTGFSLIFHCACILTAHLAYIVESLHRPALETEACAVYAYVKLYALLTGFFWLNVICIDIALKFRSLDTMVEAGPLSWRKVAWYSVYALGSPLLVVLTAVWVDLADLADYPPVLAKLKTNIGQTYCWFDTDTLAEVAYCLAPLGLLLLVNICLFVDTLFKIRAFSRRSAGVNQPGEMEKQACRNFDVRKNKRLALFAKVLALLGLSWLLEMIVWSMEFSQQHPLWVFIFFVHLVRTVATFVLFCCKRTVWRLMTSRFPLLARLRLPCVARDAPFVLPSPHSDSKTRRRSSEGHVTLSLPRDSENLGVVNLRCDTL